MFDSIEFLYTRLSTVENSIHVIDYFSLSYILIGRRISRYIIRYGIIILVNKNTDVYEGVEDWKVIE